MTTATDFNKIFKARKRKTYQLQSDFELLLRQIQASREKIRVSRSTNPFINTLHEKLRIMEKRIDNVLQHLNKRDTIGDEEDDPLTEKIDKDKVEPDEMTSIWEAANKGSLPGVKYYLLEDPSKLTMAGNIDGMNLTPIHHAVLESHYHIVEYLLLSGANSEPTSSENNDNNSPLQEACWSGNRHIAKLLLDYGANPNHQNFSNWTPLHYAVEGNHLDLVELLIENGADKSIQNLSFQTPLEMAEKYMDRPSLVHYLTLF